MILPAVKVSLKNAEYFRKKLLEINLINTDFRMFRDDEYLYIPLRGRVPKSIYGYDIIHVDFKPRRIVNHRNFLKLYGKRAFDTIGDIAILNSEASRGDENLIAKELLELHPNIKTVAVKESSVHEIYRVRKIRVIGGENKKVTIHKEHGCRFLVNVEEEYFSPRLSFERGRIADLVKDGENVLVLFAGVAPFSIVIAKRKNVKVYSVELNPKAHEHAMMNVKMNKLKGQVIPILGDVREVLRQERFDSWADRIVMPLPWNAIEFIPYVMGALKKEGWLHVYAFIDKTKLNETINKIEELTGKYGIVKNYRKVRTYSPEVEQYVFDVFVKKR